jgi:hypothetical protein
MCNEAQQKKRTPCIHSRTGVRCEFPREVSLGKLPIFKAKLLVYEQPLVAPHVMHFMHVPLRVSVKFPHSSHESPS